MLEMSVSLLVQIDKLIQVIESPPCTYIRLQLLEPHRFPYLYKCLYGLLMIMPQSTMWQRLRDRLAAAGGSNWLGPVWTQTDARPFDGPPHAPRHDATDP